jgi:hypothetical protein
MTCQEFRSYLEYRQLAGAQIDSVAAGHASNCEICAGIMEEQRELASSLHLVRESVPQLPASLNAAILANYRSYAAHKVHSPRPARSRRRVSLFAAFAWTAAVAAGLIIAAAELRLFLPSEDAPIATVPSTTSQIQATAMAGPPPSEPRLSISKLASATGAKPKRKLSATARQVAGNESSTIAATRASEALPIGFRSLMYCDALSCGGPMEMIRVQLPSSVGLAPAWAQSNQVVYADVLVGPDGIARGIRIVQ